MSFELDLRKSQVSCPLQVSFAPPGATNLQKKKSTMPQQAIITLA
jgi:hypothetical protein